MASYKFKCGSCDFIENLNISIEEFLFLKQKFDFKNKSCSNCKQITNFTRIFHPTSSKIVRGNSEMLAEIKEDARRIANDVRAGNSKAIIDIYGEEA